LNLATVLDRTSPAPLRRQIYEEWRTGILTGRFRPGARVPSTRELAGALGVSRSTVSEAWDQLIAEGYLETAHGSGTFVCRQLPEALLTPRWKPGKPPAQQRRVQLSRYGAGLSQDYPHPQAGPGVISFAPGIPDRERFPFALWRRLLVRHARQASPAVFGYFENSAGHPRLRSQIAAYLARLRAVRCSPEQVIVVNGSQQALDLCSRLLIEAGDEVAFEDPGYQGARRVFRSHGAHLIPLSIDSEGIAIHRLNGKARLVYVTPSHQYPTGISMSLPRRLELIRWADQRNGVIIEDDYCSEYRYSGPPLPSLQGLAGAVPVIYIGTFSKVLYPGLRIGYVVAPRELAPRFARAKWLADRHTPVLEQCALADFLSEGHLERHIRRMRRLYGLRREVLLDSLDRHFRDRVSVLGDAAGMHAMVRFHEEAVLTRALANKVQLVSADGYYLTRPPGGEVLMGFSAIAERSIREGVKRLCRGN
jgi:GntR family transcriptional regulator / MocR family aminotransferase